VKNWSAGYKSGLLDAFLSSICSFICLYKRKTVIAVSKEPIAVKKADTFSALIFFENDKSENSCHEKRTKRIIEQKINSLIIDFMEVSIDCH